jgi:hypothetical protein
VRVAHRDDVADRAHRAKARALRQKADHQSRA